MPRSSPGGGGVWAQVELTDAFYPGDTKKFNSTKAQWYPGEYKKCLVRFFSRNRFPDISHRFHCAGDERFACFCEFFDMLKKNVMYLSLIPSFGTFIQLLSVFFPSPRTSSLWVKDNICYFTYFSASVLFLLSLERLIKRNAVCSSHFSPMSNQIV